MADPIATSEAEKRHLAEPDFVYGIADILRLLPHRYPFLLVDRILELEPEKRVVGLKNVGTGVETSVNRLFNLMCTLTGFRGQPQYGPRREGDLRRSALDVELAAKELGWQPWTSLKDGLRMTVDSFRQG